MATTGTTQSTQSVQGTMKMGKPDGPITFNGKQVQPGDPEYAAASQALIQAQQQAQQARSRTPTNPAYKSPITPVEKANAASDTEWTSGNPMGDFGGNGGGAEATTVSPQEKAKLDTPAIDFGEGDGWYAPNQIEKAQREAELGELGINTALPSTAKLWGRPNPLDAYANYTYGLSLHVLTPNTFNKLINEKDYQYIPVTDAGNGAVLIASAGRRGEKFKRDVNFVEDFYFENLQFNAIIGSSQRSRNTNLIQLNFKIIEPYGITLMNRLLAVANSLSVKNWDQMPFMLEIEFYGNTDEGLPVGPIIEHTKFIPIKLISCKIKASVKGSEYSFEAIPYSHLVFSESNCTTPAFFEVQASTVEEFFSATRPAGEAGAIFASQKAADEARTTASKEVTGTTIGGIDFGVGEGWDSPTKPEGQRIQEAKKADDVVQANQTTPYKTYSYTAAMNEYQKQKVSSKQQKFADEFEFIIADDIKKSQIVIPKRNQASNTKMTNAKVNSKEVAALRKQFYTVPDGVDNNTTTFSLNAGTSVIEVINLVLKNSEYIRKQIIDTPQTKLEDDKPLDMYKIIPTLHLGEYDDLQQVYQKKITYHIIKYKYYNTKFPKAVKSLPTKIVKEYHYMYSGKNQSILDFSIDFDYMFFSILTGDTTKQEKIATTSAGKIEQDPANSGSITKGTISPNKIKVVPLIANASNSITPQSATAVAANDLQKSQLSSSSGDMIKVQLKISGDPEFIKQDDLFFNPGNTLYSEGDNVIVDKNLSLVTDTGEVYVWLSFRTPTDYDQSTGLMDFTTYKSSVFSGLYSIVVINNSFERGQFTQTLELARLFEQTETDLANLTNNPGDERKPDASTVADTKKAESAADNKNSADGATDTATTSSPTSDQEVSKNEQKQDQAAKVTTMSPEFNRQELQKINDTAATISITSTADDGNVVDMGLSGAY